MSTTSLGSPVRTHGGGRPPEPLRTRCRSLRAAIGALVLLFALPFTIAFDMMAPGYSGIVIHLLLAIGTLLVGLSVFDFAAPLWLSRVACGAACALAAIFFLQAQAELPANEALRSVAYSRELGGWLEAITVATVMAWLIAVALTFGRGVTLLR